MTKNYNDDVYMQLIDPDTDEILGDPKQFKAVASVQIPFESSITENVVEDGMTVSDTIIHARPKITVKMTLFNDHNPGKYGFASRWDAYNYLFDIWWNKKQFTFTCDLGEFKQMYIASLSPEETNSSLNTFGLDMTVVQVLKVTYIPVTFQYITDKDGTIIQGAPVVNEAVKITLYKPQKKKTKGFNWDEAWQNFTESFLQAHFPSDDYDIY